MKHSLFYASGLMVLFVMMFAANPTNAQITRNGPYYATPSWDQKLLPMTRFIVLSNWNSEAVLDQATGLVWEKSPSTSPSTWLQAQLDCNALTTGNRLGWRLPTLQELASLADPSASPPTLPSGHPFINIKTDKNYWSATTIATDTTYAWGVNFYYGTVANIDGPLDVRRAANNYFWCVRGGQGVAPQ